MLTLKQEKFVQGLLDGLSQRESYRKAYNCETWTDNAIDISASRLFNNAKVALRYSELLSQITDKALYTRTEAIQDALWIKNKAKNEIDSKGLKKVSADTFLGAIDRLVNLNGLDLATTKNLEMQSYKIQELINKLRSSDNDTDNKTATMLEELIKNV